MLLNILIVLGCIVIVVILNEADSQRRVDKAKHNLWPYDADGNLEREP